MYAYFDKKGNITSITKTLLDDNKIDIDKNLFIDFMNGKKLIKDYIVENNKIKLIKRKIEKRESRLQKITVVDDYYDILLIKNDDRFYIKSFIPFEIVKLYFLDKNDNILYDTKNISDGLLYIKCNTDLDVYHSSSYNVKMIDNKSIKKTKMNKLKYNDNKKIVVIKTENKLEVISLTNQKLKYKLKINGKNENLYTQNNYTFDIKSTFDMNYINEYEDYFKSKIKKSCYIKINEDIFFYSIDKYKEVYEVDSDDNLIKKGYEKDYHLKNVRLKSLNNKFKIRNLTNMFSKDNELLSNISEYICFMNKKKFSKNFDEYGIRYYEFNNKYYLETNEIYNENSNIHVTDNDMMLITKIKMNKNEKKEINHNKYFLVNKEIFKEIQLDV